MAKAIINKHIDSIQDVVLTDLFIQDEEKNKGELVICNDPTNPTIYIMDTTGNPRKIAGGGGSGSGGSYDDTAIWNDVNQNTEAIAEINEKVQTLDGTVTTVAETVEGFSGTIDTITEKVNDVTENLSGVSASIGEVPEGSTLVGMINNVQSNVEAALGATETNAQAIEEAKNTISGVEATLTEEIESLRRVDTNLNTTIKSVDNKLNSTIESIGTVAEGSTVVGMINDVQGKTETNEQAIEETKATIDEYTVNSKKISENPVLNTDDILVADTYSTLNKPADNVNPGDIITAAISKIEIMLANTTLALTAAINDLERRLQTLEDFHNESNTEPEA